MSRKLYLGAYTLIFSVFLSLLFVSTAYCDTLQVNIAQDACIDAENPDLNYGSDVALYVESYDSKQRRSLIQFDLSTIPSDAQITSATLKFYYASYSCSVVAGDSPSGRIYWAYQVTQPWTDNEITWNRYDGINSWTNTGGDYTEAGGASLVMPGSFPTWVDWDVTSIVEAWVEDSQPNYGFLIKDGDETATVDNWVWASFRSSEYSTQADRNPILEIIYTQSQPDLVVPEVPFGSIIAVGASFAALIIVAKKSKK